MRSRKQDKYFEKKLVVELYLTSELSYQELALREGIYNPSQICKWVNDFQIAGPDALRPHKKGRKKTLGTSNKKLNIEQDTTTVPVDTSTEHVKELEDEILKLRIENAYLKELRRLRLEEEALLKKQRESSTASGRIQIKRHSRSCWFSKGNIYVLAKRFDRENPDIELEEKIHEIHKCNKDYGYRRMCGELRNQKAIS